MFSEIDVASNISSDSTNSDSFSSKIKGNIDNNHGTKTKIMPIALIKGSAQSKHVMIYTFVSFSLINIFLFIAWFFYPKELHFTIMTHNMSYLGNFKINPTWWAFSISLWICAFSIWPNFVQIRTYLDPIKPWASNISNSLIKIAIFLIAMVGFLPDTEDGSILQEIHIWVALFANVSYNVGGFLLWWRGRNYFSKKYFIPVVLIYYLLVLTMLFTQIYVKINHIPFPAPGLLSFSLYEWLTFYLYLFFFYSMGIASAKKRDKLSNDTGVI